MGKHRATAQTLRLTVRLVPTSLWRKSLAQLLPIEAWRKVREQVLVEVGHCCEVCGSTDRLEADEV
jgi:hypothetical protein